MPTKQADKTKAAMPSIWPMVWWTLGATAAIFVVTGVSTWIIVCLTPSTDGAAWFSAIGTTLAIVVALVVALLQLRQTARAEAQRRADLVVVAYDLAREALELVTGRLEVALSPGRPGSHFELREHRTTETALALREIEPHALPPAILKDFVQVRSRIYAINARISDVYVEREKAKDDWTRDPANAGRRIAAFNMAEKLAGAANVQHMALQAYRALGEAGAAFGVTPAAIVVPTVVSSHPAWKRAAAATP